MRLEFSGYHTQSEERALAEVDCQIQAFWRAIGQTLSEGAMRGATSPPAVLDDSVQSALEEIHEDLTCLFVPESGCWRIVVSASGNSAQRPLVERVVSAQTLPDGWRALGAVPRVPVEVAMAEMKRRYGADLTCARARAGFTRGHLVKIVMYLPDCGGAEDLAAREVACAALELLLGERALDDWVGEVDVAALAKRSSLPVLGSNSQQSSSFPVVELQANIDAAIAGVRAGLPEEPYANSCDQDGWTMFELSPEPDQDGSAQDDLVMATTMLPEMVKAYLQGEPIASSRFSRNGENFCYLKLDASRRDSEQRLRQRRRLEDELNDLLAQEALGCVIGNGLGVQFSYVYLAVTDPLKAASKIRDLAGQLDLPLSSWLLFFDASRAREWIGLWDKTPAPPGA